MTKQPSIPLNRILFVTHEASLTGAPIMLLNFLRWLKFQKSIPFDILIIENGPITPEFKKLAPTYVWNQVEKPTILTKLSRYIFRRSKTDRKTKKMLNLLSSREYSVIYANSIASSKVLRLVNDRLNKRSILHIHELETVTSFYQEEFSLNKKSVSKFIAASKLVKDNLVDNHQISAERIQIIHEFIPVIDQKQIRPKRETLVELGIPENAFIVGGSGTVQVRKGPDFFIQAARQILAIAQSDMPIYFLWLGKTLDQRFFRFLQYDLKKFGIISQVLFLDEKENPLDYIGAFDLFIMCSREDPFPLVCLECGQLGIPIICFDQGIGSVEFLDNTTGAIVPYGNTGAIAEAVIEFINSPQKLEQAAISIQKKAAPFTVNNMAEKLFDVINLD